MTQHTATARADRFSVLSARSSLDAPAILADADVWTHLRLFVHYFVYYAARHPEQMRPMVQEGTADSPPFAEHVRPIQNTYGMNRYGTSSQ
jgi:hypothetical protein